MLKLRLLITRLALVISGLVATWELVLRLFYEIRGPTTADTTVYWAVGRGMVNGLTPYRDLFESKPPGIFMLSAFSCVLGGGHILMSILQALAILVIAVVPATYFCLSHKPFPGQRNRHRTLMLLGLVFGLLLALYSAERSGEIQVESFGAAALAGYLLLFANPHQVSVARMLVASLCLLAAIGMKEPFLIGAFCIALLAAKSLRTFLKLFIVPLIAGGALGLLGLWLTGALGAYVHIYLPYMLGSRISVHGSPLVNGLAVHRLIEDLNLFGYGMGFLLLAIVCTLLVAGFTKLARPATYLPSASLAVVIYLTSFSVGLGGQYYNHHFVFAVPCYLALFVLVMSEIASAGPRAPLAYATPLLIALLLLGTFALPKNAYEQRLAFLKSEERIALDEAKYIDTVLDQTGLERYLFIGSNGPQLYGYSKHSPLGPYFFQYDEWLDASQPAARDRFLQQIAEAKIVVFADYHLADLTPEIEARLQAEFTPAPWARVRSIPRQASKYRILFRQSLEP